MFIPIVILRLIIVFVLGLTGLDLGSGSRDDTDSSPARAIVAIDDGPTDEPTEPANEPVDEPVDEPVGEPAGPGKLTVDTGNISLPLGVYDGSFTLGNVGESALEWQWVGDPRIDLSHDTGVLEAGESVVISYAVDPSGLNAGENLLANCVVHDDGAVDVWITLTKPSPPPTIPAHLTS